MFAFHSNGLQRGQERDVRPKGLLALYRGHITQQVLLSKILREHRVRPVLLLPPLSFAHSSDSLAMENYYKQVHLNNDNETLGVRTPVSSTPCACVTEEYQSGTFRHLE